MSLIRAASLVFHLKTPEEIWLIMNLDLDFYFYQLIVVEFAIPTFLIDSYCSPQPGTRYYDQLQEMLTTMKVPGLINEIIQGKYARTGRDQLD